MEVDSAQTFKVKLLLSRLFPVWLRRRCYGSDAAVGPADLTLSLWRRCAADSNGATSQPQCLVQRHDWFQPAGLNWLPLTPGETRWASVYCATLVLVSLLNSSGSVLLFVLPAELFIALLLTFPWKHQEVGLNPVHLCSGQV